LILSKGPNKRACSNLFPVVEKQRGPQYHGVRREKNDGLNIPVQKIAIVGTGVIGASWAAEFLAHGFDVVATDPAANAEQNLRRFVDAAWPALTAKGPCKDRVA